LDDFFVPVIQEDGVIIAFPPRDNSCAFLLFLRILASNQSFSKFLKREKRHFESSWGMTQFIIK